MKIIFMIKDSHTKNNVYAFILYIQCEIFQAPLLMKC